MNMPTISRLVARFAGFLFGLAVIGSGQPAGAIPVPVGQTLKVEFSFSSPPDIGFPQLPADDPRRIADLFHGVLDATLLGFGPPSVTFALYDGSALLGSYSFGFAPPFTAFAFAAPDSLYTFRATSVSDFSSIADGTIEGILLITNTGPVDLDLSVGSLGVGHAISANGYIPFTPQPQFNQTLLVTEPMSAAMLLTGLLVWAAAPSRRRRRA